MSFDFTMRRASPWLAAIFFALFLWLGYLYLNRGAQAALRAAEEVAAEKEADQRVMSLRRQLADAETAEAAAAAKASAAPLGRGPVLHMDDLVRDHPELAPIRERGKRRLMMYQYGPVLAGLNLSPETLARLKDLLLERIEARSAASRAVLAGGAKLTSPEWNAAVDQASAGVEEQITSTLQTAGSLNWQQLQARLNYYSTVQYTYGTNLADAGAALNPAQSQALVQALADANYDGKDSSARPAGYNDSDPATGLSPYDKRLLTLASQFLTEAQLQVLRTNQLEANQREAIAKSYGSGGEPAIIVP